MIIINAETGDPVDLEQGPSETWWTPRATAAFLASRRRGGADAAADAAPSPLYARLVQGECATLRGPAANGASLGSQDATTCAVVALWLAHLDAPPGDNQARRLARLMAERSQGGGSPALYVVGAYDDEEEEQGEERSPQRRRKRKPACVATAALRFVARAAELANNASNPIRLVLACVGSHNTSPTDGSPLATALAVDLNSGAASCRVEPGGPSVLPRQAQRLASALTGQRRGPRDLVEVQVVESGSRGLEVRVPEPPPGWQRLWWSSGDDDEESSPLAGLRSLLALREDQAFLRRVSTSPLHEPPWFAEEMREQFSWVIAEVERFVAATAAAAARQVPAAAAAAAHATGRRAAS
jgi:hypothetical protein